MSPIWLPADWHVDADGVVTLTFHRPMHITEALILRDLLVTSSRNRGPLKW